VSLPIVGQKDAPQIRMIVKYHSKQIVSLSFVPVGGAPYAGNARHVRIVFIQQDLQPYSMVFGRRKQMVINFESRLFFRSPIETADVREKVEFKFRRGFQITTGVS